MRTSAVSKEYAKALFLLAKRKGKLDEIGTELDSFNQLVESNKPIKNFLLAPQLSAETKVKALKQALSGRVSQELFKFLLVLTEKRRQDYLSSICASYHDELNKFHNQVDVFIESAVDLTEKEKDKLVTRLSEHLKRKVVARLKVNPGLLGGLICRIGDMVYDGSLRRRIQRLSMRMLKAKI
jgi:F-type H+-transporting ATPase subunit delta